MKQQKLTIAEKMQEAKTQAKDRINSLLWDNEDPDKIAAAAISGGLQPEDIAQIENAVQTAKQELKKLSFFDIAKITGTAKKAKATYDAASLTVTTAEEIQEAAAGEYDLANGKLVEVQRIFNEVAQKVEAGKIPIEKAPLEVVAIIDYRKVSNRVTYLLSEHSKLKGIKRKKIEAMAGAELTYKNEPETLKQQVHKIQKVIDSTITDIKAVEKEQAEIGEKLKKLKALTILK